MYNDDDMSGGFNNMAGPYQFLNQAAVTNAMASGQNIDWAQLAQQWIQMRDSTTPAIGVAEFSTVGCDNASAPSSLKYEEKGEADMDMDDEEHMEERTTADRNKRNSSAVMQQPASNTSRSWFTDKINLSNAESRTDVSSHKANQWSSTQTSCDPHVANRQTNSTAHIPSLLSMNVPHPNEIRALPDNSNEQNSQQTMMDAAKRKALPAWIRDGLEKMEREKQKQQEQNFKDDQSENSDDGSLVHFKVATVNSINLEKSDDEDDDTMEAVVFEPCSQTINEKGVRVESEVHKTYEQKLSELMVVVRRTLTELLLEVTNEEIAKVANEAVKSSKLKASSAQVIHKSALSSITSKLGLAAYDDSSSDECSDDDEDECDNSPLRKTFASESGIDSEEDIKNAVRSKRRAFAKIANEIEERVAAAASKEEEKLKYFSSKEESTAGDQNNKAMERNAGSYQRESDAKDAHATQISAGCSGKLFERDTGETTETMLQTLNGKLQKERGARKERTTRFSDNRDNKYLAIAASASYIRDLQSVDPMNSTTNSSQTLTTSLGQTVYKAAAALTSSTSSTVEAGAEIDPKNKTALSPEKIIDRDRDKKHTYLKKNQRRRDSRDSTPDSQSSSSSSSSSSSTSSDLDSSTSNSSDNSRYSNKSHRKHSSHVSNTDKSKTSRQSQRDKRDDKKYRTSYADKDRDSYHSRYRSRSRSRSRHHRTRHGSYDSDKDYSRRKHDSRYSSSHSRSRNSSHRYHDYSTSNSRSSYSSSSNRRH